MNRKLIKKYLKEKGIQYSQLEYVQRKKNWVMVDEKGNERNNQPYGEWSALDSKGLDIGISFLCFKKRIEVYKLNKFQEHITA